MEKVDKTFYLTELFDLYQGLLTDKQANYFRHYYFDDETYQEIGQRYQISRNAIFDQLSKVEEALIKYEAILKLYDKNKKRLELWDNFDKTNDLAILKKLRKVDETDGK